MLERKEKQHGEKGERKRNGYVSEEVKRRQKEDGELSERDKATDNQERRERIKESTSSFLFY
jgi:hypothetical protein